MDISRIHESVFAQRERRFLIEIASKLPAVITPDLLTTIGFLGCVIAGAAYWASNYSPMYLWVASVGLLINWFGDSLDGTLSRYRKIERPCYGFFIDHTTDVFSQLFLFIGLGMSPYLHFDMACLALMSYWIASLYTFIRAIATKQFQISYGGFGPTEIRLALIINNAILFFCAPIPFQIPFIGLMSFLDTAILIIFIVVFVSFFSMMFFEGRRLAKVETNKR